jgi:predicted RNA-binding Zn-ribbon protein involved in translation (DUF1610 family)
MAVQKPKIQKTNGICSLCGSLFSKMAMKKHLVQCVQKHPKREPSKFPVPVQTRLFTVLLEGSFLHEYWIYIEVPANSMLVRLDTFLRDTWVECCGHLSAFTINGIRYMSETDEYFKEDKSMNYVLDKILMPGQEFSYEYDFGSTTYIRLKVVHEREVEDSDRSIEILARNDPPLVMCDSCGKIATYICRQCSNSGEGWVCDDCAPDHICGEEILLPVVNSPRVGMCGYTGLD